MNATAAFPVYLVGGGPGDPELLTVKAVRLLQQADAVIYDRLISLDVMKLVPPGAMRIYVGKANHQHTMSQDEINELLARLARTGRRVVRLKGGDPFIFGRGSEEVDYLTSRGIACEIVPGVTAAAGCAAAAGIPLTHRGLANGVRFVTGHCREDADLELNWASLADPDTTLVAYMALANLPQISRELIAAGLSPSTPAAAIASGTLPGQKLCRATLAELPKRVVEAGLKPPVLTVIGRVVALADIMSANADETVPPERLAGHG